MKRTICSPLAPAAVGPYCQAVDANGTLYVSGQLPLVPAVVKTTVLLQHISDFGAMNAIYADYFKGSFPARVCYEVAALPKGALVEIDCVAVK